MIVEYIRYQLNEHRTDELVQAYAAAGEHLKAAEECVGYELSLCAAAPDSAILRICWTSAEAHMERFREGPNFPPFLALIRPFIGEIAEMRHYDRTEVRWQR